MQQVSLGRLFCHTASRQHRAEPDRDPEDLRSNILWQPRSWGKDIRLRSMTSAILERPLLEDFRSVPRLSWEPGCKERRKSPMCYSTAPSRGYVGLGVLRFANCEWHEVPDPQLKSNIRPLRMENRHGW